jgi:ribosomal protein S18 acetylase RimI-like enzyme
MKETLQQSRVRDLTAQDETAWLRLWAGYLVFYDVEMTDEQTNLTWSRLMDPASKIKGLVALDSTGRVVGMCNYILHDNTWTATPVCYLEDLMVEQGVRGGGVGEAMIAELKERMDQQGWARIYWMTRENNYRARGLYDKFSKADGFVRYVIKAKS